MSVRVLVGFEDGLRPRIRRRIPGGATGIERIVRRAVRATFAAHRDPDAGLSVTFLADERITELNRRFLAHDGPTDVLSFALYEPGEPPVGDVYIGLEQALRQAEEAGIDPREEVARLAVHGSLHVLGHDHPKGVGRTRSAMWIMQEQIVGRVMNATDVRTSTSTRTGTRTNAPGTAAGRQSLS